MRQGQYQKKNHVSLYFSRGITPEFCQRTRLLMTVVSIVFLFLTGRLFFLQIVQGERFTYLSENNRIRLKKIPGFRGMIFDRKGQLMVDNRPAFDLLFTPEDVTEPETALAHLAHFLGRDNGEFLELLDENKTRRRFDEIVLARDIDWRSVVAVETHQIHLPGVTLRIRPQRSYLKDSMAAHLLGYLGEISLRQLKAELGKGYVVGDEIGQFGLERSWEGHLRGRSGGLQVEVDSLGRQVRVLHEVEDVPGHSVFLTLDMDLQEYAYQALNGKEGAIVVLEVNSGAILALVSSPAFDPNVFARGITSEEWHALRRDRMRPFINRAIQGQYPPGSTFKIVLAIAALEEGVIQPETRIFDPGYFIVGDRKFKNWKKGGHGEVDLNKALVESCDVYFYELGMRLGVDRIARYARMLGLGEKTGIALDNEKPGLIPDSEWKMTRFEQPWFPGETPSVAIGQSFVAVTPLQMANLMAAVANGGTLYRPWFVRKVETLDGSLVRKYGPEEIRSVALKGNTLGTLRRALREVVSSNKGTGKKARSDLVEIAGKTGTAQVTEMREEIVKGEEIPYRIRDHAWFVAYAPAEKPEIAVVTLVEHGGGGGSVAAPLAKRVIEQYFSSKGQPVASSDRRRVLGQRDNRAD